MDGSPISKLAGRADVEARLDPPDAPEGCAPDLACTLSPTERPARRAEFETLAAHVTGWTRTDRALHVEFPAGAAIEDRIRALTAEEQRCCSFLTFALHPHPDTGSWRWDIRAPDTDAAAALDEFLPLLPPDRQTGPT